MTKSYAMDPMIKCYFYMDVLFDRHAYFYNKQRTDSSTYDGDYHDPKDVDWIIVHYPPAEPGAKPDV
jgi:hypothetical protein